MPRRLARFDLGPCLWPPIPGRKFVGLIGGIGQPQANDARLQGSQG